MSNSFCGNRVKMNIQFCYHLCCSSSVLFETILLNVYDLFLSMLIFTHCSSLLMLSSHDSCMPT
jgi:hypothetical protein